MCLTTKCLELFYNCVLGSSTLAFLQARRKKASGGGAKGMRTDIRTGEEESVRQTDAAMECDGARDDAMETKMEDVKVENRIEEKAKSKYRHFEWEEGRGYWEPL